MGNKPSVPQAPAAPTNEDLKMMTYGIWAGVGLISIMVLVILGFKFYDEIGEGISTTIDTSGGSSSGPKTTWGQWFKSGAESASSTKPGGVTKLPWGTIIPVFLGIMSIVYFSTAIYYAYTKGQYRATPQSSAQLITIQQANISSHSLTLTNGNSVCTALINRSPAAFGTITTNTNSAIGDARSLLNWRPLTVRLPGYLNGQNGPADGVFSPAFGIDKAIDLGARGFFFDIDYEDAAPCLPVVIFRDNTGIKRSLNDGDIKAAMTELAAKAFTINYDPVIVIIYLRRMPSGTLQQKNFFGAIAQALNPLSDYHLGQTDKGNFHSCRSESILFTSPITDYQKKFIVITNYDTSKLPSRPNPKDNLDFWTNARIYQDPSGISTGLGSVTVAAPTAPPAQALVGHISQLLNIDSNPSTTNTVLSNYQTQTSGKFCIAIGSPDYPYTPAEVNKLLNILGVQCVPLDVIGLGISATHLPTITYAQAPATNFASLTTVTSLASLTNLTKPADILSFWTYTGWSMKMINSGSQGFQDYKEGFEEAAPIPPATPIPGFIIPKPIAPKQPSPKMNSNGGLVTIS